MGCCLAKRRNRKTEKSQQSSPAIVQFKILSELLLSFHILTLARWLTHEDPRIHTHTHTHTQTHTHTHIHTHTHMAVASLGFPIMSACAELCGVSVCVWDVCVRVWGVCVRVCVCRELYTHQPKTVLTHKRLARSRREEGGGGERPSYRTIHTRTCVYVCLLGPVFYWCIEHEKKRLGATYL